VRELEELFPRRSSLISKQSRRKSAEDPKRPVLGGVALRRRQLRGTRHGKLIRAHVLKTGTIRVNGKRFNSPSMAAYEATGRRGAINGWHFWTYERAPGDWAKLKELRR
jgi:hypothetical protein